MPAAALAGRIGGGGAQQPRWTRVTPPRAARTATFTDPRLRESSAAAPSRRHPGLVWTIGDAGNPPWLLAIDTTGALRAVLEVPGADNADWEDAAVGPCGARTCVYIADIGDNGEQRRHVRLYRVPEPATLPRGGRTGRTARAERLDVTYADGAHDAEAFYVDPGGTGWIVTKGRTGPVLRYRIPAAAWRAGRLRAARPDTLPIDPRETVLTSMVTGAALAADGTLAIRTYRDLFLFRHDSDGTLTPTGTACAIPGLEPQGEGIGSLGPGVWVTTSERNPLGAAGVFVVRCGTRG